MRLVGAVAEHALWVDAQQVEQGCCQVVRPDGIETREVFIERFNQRVIYAVTDTEVVILAVEHAISNNDSATIDRYRRFLDPILRRMESGSPRSATQTQQLRKAMESRRCS